MKSITAVRSLHAITLTSLCAMTLACASQVKSTQAPPQQPATITGLERHAEGDDPDGSKLSASCRSQAKTAFLNKYMIESGDRTSSLCDVIEAQPSSVNSLTIMITTPTCISCKPLLRGLNEHTKTDRSTHLLVAIPSNNVDIGSYSNSELKEFVSEYAPRAQPAFDPDSSMWLGFSENAATPLVPLVVVVSRSGRGKVMQTSELEQTDALDRLVIPAIKELSQ